MSVDLSKKLVLLDRDGVLNEDLGDYVCCPEDLTLIESALRGIALLTSAGIRIGICTNQAGISRGRYDESMLHSIHDKLLHMVRNTGGEIERIIFCPSYDDNHPWRKPNAGMLIDQAKYFGVSLEGVPFVGDSLSDITAARRANAQPVLVETGKGKLVRQKYMAELQDVLIYPNLEEAVIRWIS